MERRWRCCGSGFGTHAAAKRGRRPLRSCKQRQRGTEEKQQEAAGAIRNLGIAGLAFLRTVGAPSRPVIQSAVQASKSASKKSQTGGKTAVPAVPANSRPRLFGQAGGLSALTGEDACLPCGVLRGSAGVPPAVFRVSRNTPRTSREIRSQADVRRVPGRMPGTAGGTPALPEARHSQFLRLSFIAGDARHFTSVSRIRRTSITCLPGTLRALSVRRPRPGLMSSVPSGSGLKSFT